MIHLLDSETGTKIYHEPAKLIFNVINDLVELQKAEVTYLNLQQGVIHYRVEMYGFTWEYRFVVEDQGVNQSRVTLEIDGEATNKADRVFRQLVLLDSMLPGEMREIPMAESNGTGC